jgi:hypothetical protein
MIEERKRMHHFRTLEGFGSLRRTKRRFHRSVLREDLNDLLLLDPHSL